MHCSLLHLKSTIRTMQTLLAKNNNFYNTTHVIVYIIINYAWWSQWHSLSSEIQFANCTIISLWPVLCLCWPTSVTLSQDRLLRAQMTWARRDAVLAIPPFLHPNGGSSPRAHPLRVPVLGPRLARQVPASRATPNGHHLASWWRGSLV